MKSIELFAGAGGLALGSAAAGFKHDAVVEWNKDACRTLKSNISGRFRQAKNWKLLEGDVRSFTFSEFADVDLVSGGPPCQPFSIGGKHRGNADHRNLFPEVVRVVRETRPKAILVENVRGLLREQFAKFFEYVCLQLTYPNLTQKTTEDWTEHLARLERLHTRGGVTSRDLSYNVVYRCVNAADYGVPQNRFRVLIVAFRSDLQVSWSFPDPTHSADALLYQQHVSREYWDRHQVPKKNRFSAPKLQKRRIDRLRSSLFPPMEAPWRTVRDAIADLPIPRVDRECNLFANHMLNLGARSYPGHTGSNFDLPAKTLKAGDHGVPGGENMLSLCDGGERYFTVRESARLQTFPDDYIFEGSWTESMRQLGNAVPVLLGQIVATSIYDALK
jgi:DNA (cytosine-5)-methyltransferase 1